MYESIEELTKEEYDLIGKVYKAVSHKPSLFISIMNACYSAFYEPIRQATNTDLLVAILDLAKESMELKDRVKTIEAENANLRNQLRDAKGRC